MAHTVQVCTSFAGTIGKVAGRARDNKKARHRRAPCIYQPVARLEAVQAFLVIVFTRLVRRETLRAAALL
jgi:hypothetical protein